jgi:hypothetical protein
MPRAQTYMATPPNGIGSPNQPVIIRLVCGGGIGGRRQATQSHTLMIYIVAHKILYLINKYYLQQVMVLVSMFCSTDMS